MGHYYECPKCGHEKCVCSQKIAFKTRYSEVSTEWNPKLPKLPKLKPEVVDWKVGDTGVTVKDDPELFPKGTKVRIKEVVTKEVADHLLVETDVRQGVFYLGLKSIAPDYPKEIPVLRLKPEDKSYGVHMSHCYQGEQDTWCKYGNDDICPAKPESKEWSPGVNISYPDYNEILDALSQNKMDPLHKLHIFLKINHIDHTSIGEPRLHGNGFIQVDIGCSKRVNVWTPRTKELAQKVSTQIHNHRFGFLSTVYVGTLENTVYTIFPDFEGYSTTGNYYRLWEAVQRDKEDTELVMIPDHLSYHLAELCSTSITVGHSYVMSPAVYHESYAESDIVLTVMEKIEVVNSIKPYVLVKDGKKPDNDFNRYQVPVSELWNEVSLALEAWKVRD